LKGAGAELSESEGMPEWSVVKVRASRGWLRLNISWLILEPNNWHENRRRMKNDRYKTFPIEARRVRLRGQQGQGWLPRGVQ